MLWAYQITLRTTTQETLFSLTYRAKAVVPVELIVPSSRISCYVLEENEQAQQTDLDLLEERREAVALKMTQYKNIIARHYNAQVKHLYFRQGDLVLRKNSVSHAEPLRKLNPKWKGPYRVVEISENGYCN